VTPPGDTTWQDALTAMRNPAITAVLTVQCSLGWLRPETAPLRNEVDEAITALALARPAVRIDRVVLHNLSAIGDTPAAELDELNRAHADWLYRLALTGAVLPDASRPRVHRLMVRGTQRTVETVDGIELQVAGIWVHPDPAEAAVAVVRRAGMTTPLTTYDVDLDGPFGDADPSVYL